MFYDYMFYKLVTLRDSRISKVNSVYSTILLMSIILTFYLMIGLVIVGRIVKVDIEFLSPESNFVFKLIPSLCVLAFNLYYFIRDQHYQNIIENFNSKQIKNLQMKNLGVFIFLSAPFIISLFFIMLGAMGYLD